MTALGDEVRAAAVPPDKAGTAWRSSVSSTFADIETGGMPEQVSDWDGVLRHFGLDPAEFEVVDDTVRMSSWQQGEEWRYAYRARFRRVERIAPADLEALTKRLDRWKPSTARKVPSSAAEPATFYVGWSDWQVGKQGVDATVERVLQSFDQTVDRIKHLRRVGRNIPRLAVWNMGDPIEGCDSSYASQLFTVELTRREQLNLALDLWLTGMRTLAPLFEDVEFGSVLCNHGEWGRQGVGTKQVTSDSDNVGGYLADTLQRVLADRPGFEHVRYTIPSSEMTMATVMSGVPVALAHGHKAPGGKAEIEWMQAQSLRLLRENGAEPRLWMTAHRHTYSVVDHGPWHRIQHPTLDQGSKWYADATGKWSSPGTFTCVVGEHPEAGGSLAGMGRGFSDEAVLIPAA